jgi:hypothetical protein
MPLRPELSCGTLQLQVSTATDKLYMTEKCPAKTRRRSRGMAALMAITLTSGALPGSALADFDGLNQQLRMEQQKSRFQLMLEQVQESARRRARQAQTAAAASASAPTPVDLGGGTESVRLDAVTLSEPPPQTDAAWTRPLEVEQARERDQRGILDQQQQRRGLIAGPRARTYSGDLGGYASKRRELVRFGTQNQRLSLQRKLRR